MINSFIIAPGLRAADLGGERVQVDQQEFAELVHLVRNFFGGFFFPMNCLVAVEAKLVSPRLQLWRNSVFGSHLVDPFLNLPRIDVWGKRLQAKLHSFSVHSTRSIEMTCASRPSSLFKCPFHILRNIVGRLPAWGLGEKVDNCEMQRRLKNIAGMLRRVPPRSGPDNCNYGPTAYLTLASHGHRRLVFVGAPELPYYRKAAIADVAVRAVVNHYRHGYRLVSKKVIVA